MIRNKGFQPSEMKTLCLALICQCFVTFTLEQSFEILRRSNGRDSFDIPSSVCNPKGPNPAVRCKTLGAFNRRRKKCSCLCPGRNATFMFHQKKWSCLPNAQGRSHYYRGKKIQSNYLVQNCWVLINELRNKATFLE